VVVRDLASVIWGWTEYYHHVCSANTFAYAGHRNWRMLWQWAKRRHPKKSKSWVKARYFRQVGSRDWNFTDAVTLGGATLPWHCDTKIVRHIKVKGTMSPLDPDVQEYWTERRKKRMEARIYSKRRQELLRTQEYACASCKIPFEPEGNIADMDEHHDKPRHKGGGNETANLRLLHRWCHHKHHQVVGYKAVEA
jgi:RNA-directed DNA polymerase